MKYVYAVELYRQFIEEAAELIVQHYREMAVDGEDELFEMDHPQYQWLCDNGKLHIVTVRHGGILVGYHMSFIRTQLHRKQVLSAFTEGFYVIPAHRKGLVGYKLFTYVEETLRRKGVRWMYTGTTVSKDLSAMLCRQGYKEIEKLFLKIIQ